MSSFFSSPNVPETPEPPAQDEVSDTTEAEKRRRRRLKRGLTSTLLAPVGEELPELQTKTLFGVA